MKKLWFLVLLLFVPVFFVGCFGDSKDTPENVGLKAFRRLNEQTSYVCTLTYTENGKEIEESCSFDSLWEINYYYYYYKVDGEIQKQYWLDEKSIITMGCKDVDGTVSYLLGQNVTQFKDEASNKFYLLEPEAFNYSEAELKLGELKKDKGEGDYTLTLGEHTFTIKNNNISEIIHKDYKITYNVFDARKLPYPNFSKGKTEGEGKATFDQTMDKLEKLEALAQTYITQNELNYTPKYLALNFIRSGKSSYCTRTWNMILGSINQSFIDYVEQNQGEDDLMSLKTITTLTEPYTAKEIDFMHLMAVISFGEKCGINGAETDLGGFGGDIGQLTVDIKDVDGDSSEIEAAAQEKFGSDSSGFSMEDYDANIAAINIVADFKTDSSLKLCDAVKNYFYSNHDSVFATRRFISLIGLPQGSVESAEDYLISRLEKNTYITIWLNQNNVPISSYSYQFEASTRAFVKFLYSCL